MWNFAHAMIDENLSMIWKYLNKSIVLFIVTFVLVAFTVRNFGNWMRKKLASMRFASSLPGPPAWPLIGNALEVALANDDGLYRIERVMKNFSSPMRFWLGPIPLILTSDPRDYEIILGNSKASQKAFIYKLSEEFVGKGLLTSSGSYHRLHRKIIMPMINSRALEVYVQSFDKCTRVCADILGKERVNAGEFDILPYLVRCSANIIFDTVMGVAASDVKDDEYEEFIHWSERFYELFYTRATTPWLHPDVIYRRTEFGKQQRLAIEFLRKFLGNMIEKKRKEHEAIRNGNFPCERARVMLLEQLIEHVDKSNAMDDKELRDAIYTVFLAGWDTTSLVASFVFLLLSLHPDVQEKVREEITSVVGTKEVRLEELHNLKYLEMVIKETIRLFPVGPILARETIGKLQLKSCTLPEGCTILLVPYVTHRDPKHWKNPEKFIPERFLPENSKERHPFAFIPFSAGIRSCIGQKMAMLCLKTISVHLLRKFRFTSSIKNMEEIRLKVDISVRSVNGYRVSINNV